MGIIFGGLKDDYNFQVSSQLCMNFVMLYTTHNVLCVSREVNKIAVNVCTYVHQIIQILHSFV